MNQILVINNMNKVKRNKIIYLIILYTFVIIFISLLVYLFYSYFMILRESRITNILKNQYIISTLYPTSTNYTSLKISNNISIIGSIDIPKIEISYPIIENTNDELLKFSVCKFTGPLPNRVGNLCIAGHNYKNSLMFSKLYKLNIGDSFFITDLNNIKLKYIIYDKFIVKENNLDCTKDTNNIEVTLITCNNLNNSERLIIKAKMEG